MDDLSFEGENTETTLDSATNTLRVRLRRVIPAGRGIVFAAFTDRVAWNEWMRLRARARATLSPHIGGAYRLELAEGARIHLITGVVRALRSDELVELTWMHHDVATHASIVEISLRAVSGGTEVTLTHSRIGSRRQAAWLARSWTLMLGRLREYVSAASLAPVGRPPAPASSPRGAARQEPVRLALTF